MLKAVMVILALIVIIFAVGKISDIGQSEEDKYRNLTIGIADAIESLPKLGINASEEGNVQLATNRVCDAGKIIIEKTGTEERLRDAFDDPEWNMSCRTDKLENKIGELQEPYNSLIEHAVSLQENAPVIELDRFNAEVGRFAGQVYYYPISRLKVWGTRAINNTLNISQEEISETDKRYFELAGQFMASVTPSIIKGGIITAESVGNLMPEQE